MNVFFLDFRTLRAGLASLSILCINTASITAHPLVKTTSTSSWPTDDINLKPCGRYHDKEGSTLLIQFPSGSMSSLPLPKRGGYGTGGRK